MALGLTAANIWELLWRGWDLGRFERTDLADAQQTMVFKPAQNAIFSWRNKREDFIVEKDL